MKYEMKSILKSKVTLVCFLIFLVINMFSIDNIDLENQLENNIIANEQLMVETQSTISNLNIMKRQLGKDIKPEQINIFENYEKYLNWKKENAHQAILQLKKEGISAFDSSKNFKKYDVWNQIFEMDCFAKTDDLLSHIVFKDELSQLEYPNISFDPTKLNDIQQFIKKNYEVEYHHIYINLQNTFFDMKTGNDKNILNIMHGPWLYLCSQLRIGSIFSLMIMPIGLFYTVIIIWQQKQSGSFKLSFLNTKTQLKFIVSKIFTIMLSYLLIVCISLLIPILILGICYGFNGLNSYMLIDWNNFFSFECNLNTYHSGWIRSGFSEYLISMDNNMPIEMTNIIAYIPLALALLLGVMKITFVVTIGMFLSFYFKRQSSSYVVGLIIVLLIIYSQQITLFPALYPTFNPFSIISSLTVIAGNGAQTTMNAIILLLGWSTILFILIYSVLERKDMD